MRGPCAQLSTGPQVIVEIWRGRGWFRGWGASRMSSVRDPSVNLSWNLLIFFFAAFIAPRCTFIPPRYGPIKIYSPYIPFKASLHYMQMLHETANEVRTDVRTYIQTYTHVHN